VEGSVAVPLEHELARLAMELRIHQHRCFGGVPVVEVVRRELVVPFQLPRGGVERQHGRGVQIVSLTLVTVVVRAWIAGGPVKQLGFRVVSAGEPGGAATVLQRPTAPTLRPRLTRRRDGPEPPDALAGVITTP